MQNTCFRIAGSRFKKSGPGSSGLNYLLRHIRWHTLLTPKKQVVDAKHFFSHCTLMFSKNGWRAVWTGLPVWNIYSGRLFSLTNNWWWIRKMCLALHTHVFKKWVRDRLHSTTFLKHILGHTLLTHKKLLVGTTTVFSHVDDDATKCNLNVDHDAIWTCTLMMPQSPRWFYATC